MNATPALLRYLARELATRWRAQPASPLARWWLTLALTAAAGVFLAGFSAAEAARRRELQRLGLDTLVVRSAAQSPLSDPAPLPPDAWAASLTREGTVLWLQQLPEPALTPWQQPLPALLAATSVFVNLLPPEAAGIDALWFTRSLPPGRDVRLTFGQTALAARTILPEDRWQALGLDDFVLAPAWMRPTASVAGRLDVVLFTPSGGRTPAAAAALIPALFAADDAAPPSIQDPTPYRRALDELVGRQRQWRTAVLAALATCTAAMFGSIGLLEERQTRFTQALLRSLGVRPALLWAAALVENLALANLALLGGAAASGWIAARFFSGIAGINRAAMSLVPGDWLWLAIGINAGVVISLFPLARALRRPVGRVLS